MVTSVAVRRVHTRIMRMGVSWMMSVAQRVVQTYVVLMLLARITWYSAAIRVSVREI